MLCLSDKNSVALPGTRQLVYKIIVKLVVAYKFMSLYARSLMVGALIKALELQITNYSLQ